MPKAGPQLLEPIMKVDVFVLDAHVGDTIGDLNRRRGMILGMEDTVSGKVIRAEVPLGEMFGYATSVRSLSQGRATYTMEPHTYQEVPKMVAEKILAG